MKWRDDSGVVLLETMLVIPLYLVLIGATMWIGDLILSRQHLLVADRYCAWNAANRHRSAPNLAQEIRQHMFDRDQQARLYQIVLNPLVRPASSPDKWWHDRRARVPMIQRMPPWVSGWIKAGDDMWGVPKSQQPPPRKSLYGRYASRRNFGSGPTRPGDHRVIMRGSFSDNDYFRYWEGRDIIDMGSGKVSFPNMSVFPKINFEPWPPAPWGKVQTVPKSGGVEYERHGQYVDWST